MSAHFPIAPSSLARIVQCPGSRVLSLPYADKKTESSIEGDAAHWVAMQTALASLGMAEAPKLGEKVHGGLLIDAEMIAGARMYAESLEGYEGWAEESIKIARIHEQCGGTPDFWQYSKRTKTLRVTDYKYGHKFVEVFENYQLIAYACGLIDRLVEQGEALEFETIVELMIVQPRCFHPDGPVRVWITSAAKLRALINVASAAAEDSFTANPKTKTGAECLYCPARPECKTAHKATTAIIEYAGTAEAMAQSPLEMGLRLLMINGALEMLKAVATGLGEQITSRLKAGDTVPYFKVDYTKPREKWDKPVTDVKMLGMLAGKVLTEETYACTPKQAVSMGIDRAVVSAYSMTPPGSPKLVEDSLNKTARVFSK